MPEIGNTTVFSQTDASNNSGTVPTWAEGMAPSQVNDSARALQGAVTREWNWRNATLTSTGVANAYVLTYGVAPAAYYNGQIFTFKTNFANTGTATLNVNTLGAKTIKKVVAGVLTALASGDVASGAFLMVAYNSADDSFIVLSGVNLSDVTLAGNNAFTGANTFAGDSTFNNLVNITEDFRLSGNISPAQITADQNDYAPAGHATASVWRLSADALRSITGIVGGANGRLLYLLNVGTNTIVLPHESALSAAANRISAPNNNSSRITQGGGVLLIYDATASRWHDVTGFGLVTQADMETAGSSSLIVAPFFQHSHPGHPKFWAYVTVSAGTPTLQTSYNVTSITDSGVGRLTVTLATAFSSANWAPIVANNAVNSGTNPGISTYFSVAAGSVVLECQSNSGTFGDPSSWSVMGLGDQ